MGIGKNIKKRRQEVEMTLEEVAKEVGVSRQTLSRYETGVIGNIPSDKIEALATALRTTPARLMGWETEPYYPLPSNLAPVPEMKKVPLIGEIACGTPILAEENISDYVDLPRHIKADYALACKGDSMINAGIRDGDVVYIRKQPQVENGEIAAVIVGEDEATLKRFYYENGVIQLVAENPRIAPKVFTGEEINRVKVVGLAVAYTHILE